MKSHGFWNVAGAFLIILLCPWANAATDDDEYNFSWLDPDKKIYVLQNRKFTKARRVLVSSMGGVGISGPYRTAYSFDNRLGYYFTEMYGIEVFHSTIFNAENNTFRALQDATIALPRVREIRSQYGLLFNYAPWYAKINVFNKILYFDWYFNVGYGSLQSAVDTRATKNDPSNYVDENLNALVLGTGHQYHINRTLTVRLDLTGAFYRVPISATTLTKSWFSNYTVVTGIGIRL